MSSSALARWAIALALALTTGCTPALCGRNSDCASGLVCTSIGACLVPADAGTDDGASGGDGETITPIRDADGDAFDIEPIDAGPPIDADLIDAPDDDSLVGNTTPAGE